MTENAVMRYVDALVLVKDGLRDLADNIGFDAHVYAQGAGGDVDFEEAEALAVEAEGVLLDLIAEVEEKINDLKE